MDLSLDQKIFLWPWYFSFEIFVQRAPFNTTVAHCKICSIYKERKSNNYDHICYLKINVSSKAAYDTWTDNFENILLLLILNCKLWNTWVPVLNNVTYCHTRRSLDFHLQMKKNISKYVYHHIVYLWLHLLRMTHSTPIYNTA